MKKIKWNYDLVKEYIEKEGYILISKEYFTVHEHLVIRCPNNHVFNMKFNNFKNGNRCRECNILSRKKYTHSEVEKLLNNEGYELLSEYKSLVTPIKVRCKYGHINDILFQSFESGHRCRKCSADNKNPSKTGLKSVDKKFSCGNKKITLDIAQQRANEIGLTITDRHFDGIKSKVNFRCGEGHNFNARFDAIIKRKKCPECTKINKMYSYEFVKKYIELDNSKLISTYYHGTYDKLRIMCEHGHEYYCNFHSFKNKDVRCPICNQSKGEKRVLEVLNNRNINVISQYKFDLCRYINKLPFDFYFPDYNICIEFDGVHHFEPVDFAGKGEEWAIENLKEVQLKDSIKNKYCLDNNIKLIRISYWDFDNIEKILANEIKNC